MGDSEGFSFSHTHRRRTRGGSSEEPRQSLPPSPAASVAGRWSGSHRCKALLVLPGVGSFMQRQRQIDGGAGTVIGQHVRWDPGAGPAPAPTAHRACCRDGPLGPLAVTKALEVKPAPAPEPQEEDQMKV